MTRVCLAVLIAALCSSAYAQTPSVNLPPQQQPLTTSTVEKPEKTQADAPEPNSPLDLLQQAYYLGGQLPVDEHAYQMGELVIVAAKMKHPMLRQWVQEVFQLTANLPQQNQ